MESSNLEFSSFQEFFGNLFTNFNTQDSVVILILLGITALLGILLGWLLRGGRVRRLKNQLAAEKKKYQLVHAENAGLEERLQLLDKEIADRDTRIETYEKNQLAFRKELNAANAKINGFNIEKRRLESEASSANLDLENKLAAFESQASQNEEQMSLRINQLAKLQEELSTVKEEKSQLEAELEKLMDGNTAVITPSSATIHNAFSQIKALDNRMRQMENENRILQSSVLEVRSESGEKVGLQDISGLRAQLNILIEENKSLKKEVTGLQAESHGHVAEMELDEIKNRIAQLETENANLKSDLVDYTAIKNSDAFDFVDLETGMEPEVYDDLLIERNINAADEIDRQQLNLLDEREKAEMRVIGDRIDVAPSENTPENISEEITEKVVDTEKEEVYEKDELTKIDGIGPFIEKKLNEIGIVSFRQIAKFDDAEIEKITKAIEFFPGRIKRDDWVGQAKELIGA